MTIFITGMFRSGSTWSFNVVRQLLLQRYRRERVYTAARDDTHAVLSEAPNHDVLLMKSHFLDDLGRSMIRAREAKAVHTFRDPADAIRSGMNAFGWSFEQCLEFVASSFDLMNLVRDAQNGCLIFYDDINRIPVQIVTVLADYIGLPIDPARASSIARAFSLDAVKPFTDALAHCPEQIESTRQLVHMGSTYYDRETFFHRRHISDGDYIGAFPFDDSQCLAIRNSLGSHIDGNGRLVDRQSVLYSPGEDHPL